jgi:hypothetical protein
VILSQFVFGAGDSLDEGIKRSLLQELENLLSAADSEENDPMEICLIMELIGNVITTSSQNFLAESILPQFLFYLILYLQGNEKLFSLQTSFLVFTLFCFSSLYR